MLKWSAFPLKHATGNTMSEFIAENRGADAITRPNWSAVFSVAFCVACLIIVEFLPVSLLTPMAQDLGISEGVAGQSVTVTAFVAMFASLFITQTIQATDRRYVVILFAVLLTLSCLLVSFANSFSLLLIGRACLGLALGGFWAMSASLTMRLVPPRTVPKALSVIFGAVSIALVIAAPLGSFLGELIGWRNVFNVSGLIEMGLSYAEIGQQLALLTRAGYIDKDKDKIGLSPKGEAYFKGLSEKMNRNVKFLWITPLFDEMIPKKDKNDVYLPKNWRI